MVGCGVGQGLNLTGADTVILHDVDFNPQVGVTGRLSGGAFGVGWMETRVCAEAERFAGHVRSPITHTHTYTHAHKQTTQSPNT